MDLQPLLETPELLICYDPANDWLYAYWQGQHTIETVRAGCIRIREALRQHPACKLLNDSSALIRPEVRITEWGLHWLEELHALGLRHMAWVVPNDFPERESSEAIVHFLGKPAVLAFDNLAFACNWLARQHAPAF